MRAVVLNARTHSQARHQRAQADQSPGLEEGRDRAPAYATRELIGSFRHTKGRREGET